MINQGFVTDSDTEKELKKWQQARTTAVDEDKLKQQYKNRLNNAQGQHFEREILAGCRMYESHGIATIDKTPEPFRVTSKNHRTGEFTGRFSTHAQPDFQGTKRKPKNGRLTEIDPKTNKPRLKSGVPISRAVEVLYMFENTDVLPYQIEEMKVTISNLQTRVKKLEDWQE